MDLLSLARAVIDTETAELQRLRQRLGPPFAAAVGALQQCVEAGRKVILCGVGKSGHIAGKIAATLTSTGAPAVLLHVQDALHGDLGIVNDGDAVIAMSASGETRELLDLLPHLRRRQTVLIAMTGAPGSALGRAADIVLDVQVEKEACPLGLAPTSSTTVMLVLGDALAMVLLEARGFQQEDFALLHPGGSLGRALLTRVRDIMRCGERLPLLTKDAPVMEAVRTMTRCRAGCVILTAADGTLAGIFTQGDFTRAYESHPSLGTEPVHRYMSAHPVTIHEDRLAAAALQLLQQHPVDELLVLDAAGLPVGLVDSQDLSRLRLV